MACSSTWRSIKYLIFLTSKVSYPLALFLTFVAFVFSWIGFAVPDWLTFTANATQTKFGLWSICFLPLTFFSQVSCSQWLSTSITLPDFLKTTQAMITLECIFVTIAVVLGFVYLLYNQGFCKYFPLLAAIATFFSFIFAIIGLAIFGNDFEAFVASFSLNATSSSRRWGYWIFVPIIIVLFFATVLFPFKFIFKRYFADRYYDFNQRKVNLNDLDRSSLDSGVRGVGYRSNPINPASIPSSSSQIGDVFEFRPNNSIILPSIQGGQANQTTLSSAHEGYIDMMIDRHNGPVSIDHKIRKKKWILNKIKNLKSLYKA